MSHKCSTGKGKNKNHREIYRGPVTRIRIVASVGASLTDVDTTLSVQKAFGSRYNTMHDADNVGSDYAQSPRYLRDASRAVSQHALFQR